MKVKKLIRKLYKACVRHDDAKERRLWKKIMRKSLEHKHTQAVR